MDSQNKDGLQYVTSRFTEFPTIVYIEDDDSNTRLIMRQLRREKVIVIAADDAESGIVAIMQHRPDFVLIDYHLPVMNGVEATKRIKAMPEIADTYVVMLTADTSSETRQAAMSAGCDAFLTKPACMHELHNMLYCHSVRNA